MNDMNDGFVSSVRNVMDSEIKAPKAEGNEAPSTFIQRHPTVATTGGVALFVVGGAAISFLFAAAAYAGQRTMRSILPQERWLLKIHQAAPAAAAEDPSPVSAS